MRGAPVTLWACESCYVASELGEVDPNETPAPLCLIPQGEVITAGLAASEHTADCPNVTEAGVWIGDSDCDCESQSFSWAFCDSCGSTLGGSRHGMTLWDESAERADYLSRFTVAYAHALLWADTFTESESGEIERDSVTPEDWQTPAAGWQLDAFSEESRRDIESDCADFVAAQWSDLRTLDPEQSGHDFLLTRNRHGAGFWDRGLGDVGERLTRAAHVYGGTSAVVRPDDSVSLL